MDVDCQRSLLFESRVDHFDFAVKWCLFVSAELLEPVNVLGGMDLIVERVRLLVYNLVEIDKHIFSLRDVMACPDFVFIHSFKESMFNELRIVSLPCVARLLDLAPVYDLSAGPIYE